MRANRAAVCPMTRYRMAIDLVTRRLERLEKGQRDTNDALARVAEILEVHSTHFERMEGVLAEMSARIDGMSGRIDRLASALIRGRTQDLARWADAERRLRALERGRTPRRRR